MPLRQLVVMLFAGALVACGSGGDPGGNGTPAEASGTLMAGGAQGVHYSTPTRSGSTDANGAFKYLPGETVSFSIGSIQLGSAPGAASITTFTLAGGTPPTTELALRRELDRARRMATPFVRAVNIQWLMLALDADHDPANGLDLRNAETVLSGATIDLGDRLIPFGSRLMKLAPGLTIAVPPWKAVAEAYRGSGVTVAVHARTANRSTPVGFPQVINYSTTYGADGVRTASGTDYGDDGTPEATLAWTYDSLGRQKTQSLHMDPASSPYATNSDLTYQFDARGARTGYNATVDDKADGTIDSVLQISYQNDNYGFPTVVGTQQFAGDGTTLVARSEERAVFDARHNQTVEAFDNDANADGVYDSRWMQTISVDASDRYMGTEREEDLDGDGAIDMRSVSTIDYSGPSGTIVTETENDDNADGVIDSRSRFTARYDSDGFLLSQVFEQDDNADGTPEYISRDEISYDPEHRIVTLESPRDDNGDGVIDWSSHNTYTYDSAGNRLTSQFALYNDGSPDPVYEINEQSTYGASGEFLSSESTMPSNGAASPAFAGSSVATQTQVADGVLLLAQDYFESGDVAYVSSL
jgi:hypothetical protein